MSLILYPPARPQSIGEVIDTAFRIFKATLIRCLPYSVMATLVGQLQNVYLIGTHQTLRPFNNGNPTWWSLYVLGLFLGFTFINAIFIRQAAMASGQPSVGSAALIEGFRKLPATIAMFLLMAVTIGLPFVVLAAVPRAYFTLILLVMCVPAACIGAYFLCAWPALLVGERGILGSPRYSLSLIRGNWWRTVTIYTVAVLMIMVLSVTMGMVVGVLAALGASKDLAVTTAISAVMVVASGALYMPFVSAMTLALYGDLQARKEGTDLERRLAGAQAG